MNPVTYSICALWLLLLIVLWLLLNVDEKQKRSIAPAVAGKALGGFAIGWETRACFRGLDDGSARGRSN